MEPLSTLAQKMNKLSYCVMHDLQIPKMNFRGPGSLIAKIPLLATADASMDLWPEK